MNNRTLLLASAATLVPLTPSLAEQPQPTAENATAPAAAAPVPATTNVEATQPTTAPPTSSGTAPGAVPSPDDLGDEEEIVVTGARPRGSVVGDIPPESTLDARDVRATGASNITELLDALA